MRRLILPFLGGLSLGACESEPVLPAQFQADDTGGGDDVGDVGTTDSGGGDTADDGMNGSDDCADVTIAYTGEMATVSGSPLGLNSDDHRQIAVSGTFSFRPCTGDGNPTDTSRGVYDHGQAAPFTLDSEVVTIRGSGVPNVEVISGDTSTWFYYEDGPLFNDLKDRTMSVDGVENEHLELWIAVGNSSEAELPDDSLPEDWPFAASLPHTFSLSDDGGTLLLQWDSLEQVVAQ